MPILIAMTQRNPVIPSELMITTTPTSKKDTSRLYIINNIIKLFINSNINSSNNSSSNNIIKLFINNIIKLFINNNINSNSNSSSNSSSNNIIKLFINNTINNIINNITPPRNLSESYHRIKHLTTPDLTFIPPIFPSPYLMVGYGGLSYVYSKFYLWVDEPRKNIYNQS